MIRFFVTWLLPGVLLSVTLAAPASALDLRVVTNHRGDDGLPSEFSDNDEVSAEPIAPGGVVFAQSQGSGYRVRSSADEFGNSAVDLQVTTSAFQSELVDIAVIEAEQIHTNLFGSPARARFSFLLPEVFMGGTAANATLLEDIEILLDSAPVWNHQGVMEFDTQGNPDWYWVGEDIGMPPFGPLNSVQSTNFFGTVDLGIIQPGQSFTLRVEKVVQLTAEKPGFIEGAFASIGDPDDLSMSPFLGDVTFEVVPEPGSGTLIGIALVMFSLVRCRAVDA